MAAAETRACGGAAQVMLAHASLEEQDKELRAARLEIRRLGKLLGAPPPAGGAWGAPLHPHPPPASRPFLTPVRPRRSTQ